MSDLPDMPSRYSPICGTGGGFSDVLFCNDIQLDRKVAIKFVREASQQRRILDELRALLQMRSKHVVQIYDIIPNNADGGFGIVEEFVEGENLLTSDYPCQSLDNYLKILWQVASGIADIHAARVIHRDIKPNNMKLDSEGIVKIFDFGLARDEGPDAATLGFVGTLGFAAPELFSTGHVCFTNAIDTYAFGVTAIFIATQRHVLPPELQQKPPHPLAPGFFARLPIRIPDRLCELFEKCLASHPAGRPQMSTLRDEIGRYLLHGKHQALAVHRGNPSYLNINKRKIRLEFPTVGKIEIAYDGFWFQVSVAEGEVFINNIPAVAGDQLPGSCVISLGNSSRRANQRAFIAFDISNPEVVL